MSITLFHHLLDQAFKYKAHNKFLRRIHDNLDKALDKKIEEIEYGGRISLTVNSFGKMSVKDE